MSAVSAELESLVNKGVLVFSDLPVSVKAIATRFILKLKYLPDGTVDEEEEEDPGWVVYGGKRHAEPPRGVSPRGYGTHVPS